MERIHAYIDESGAYGFDFSKEATPHLNLLRKVPNLTYDNSKGSSLITDMVKAAKTSGAHVKFINCTRLSSFDIANLKKLGGENVKFA